jgi:hypothetical protein
MIIKEVENPDKKWWNPFTWAKVVDFTLDHDLLILSEKSHITIENLTLTESSILSIGKTYYQRRKTLEDVESFLFPKGRRNK